LPQGYQFIEQLKHSIFQSWQAYVEVADSKAFSAKSFKFFLSKRGCFREAGSVVTYQAQQLGLAHESLYSFYDGLPVNTGPP